MSGQRYDEDLFENPFFNTLEKEHKELFERSTANRWIICIPKFSVVGNVKLIEDDFKDHILIPNPEDEGECKTVSKHTIVIKEGEIVLGKGFKVEKKVSILFEETFYNSSDESYRVCCVSTFFNKEVTEDISSNAGSAVLLKPSTSYDECFKLLWGPHGASSKVKDQLDKLLLSFCGAYQRFEGEEIPKLVDLVSSQVTDAMQMVLRHNSMKHCHFHENTAKLTNLKVAVEMYMMNVLHKHLFSTITACVKEKDAHINKMTRNLTGIRLSQLGVRKEFEDNILTSKKEIARLNEFSTPTRRILCLTRVMTALSKPIAGTHDVMMTTDDLLPLLIYLIIKSQIPNWMANLEYMKHFQQEILSQNDEFSFLLANIEAALDFICSGNVKPSNKQVVSRQASGGLTSAKEKFFQYVKFGDEAAVRLMLKQKQTTDTDIVSQLCHPLCDCDKCASIVSSSKLRSETVSPQTRDDMGRTALHLAAINGHASLIDILVKNGCLVDGACYLGFTPLHYACQNGYQNIILLLVHFGASISAVDNEGNTPLHLCAKNGHEDCVKAILFLDILKNRLDVNARNDVGDTPLHLAAKWGYEGIVKFLLDTEAEPLVRNRKRQTPLNVAQNPAIRRELEDSISYNPVIVQHPGPISTVKSTPSSTLPITNGHSIKKDVKAPPELVVSGTGAVPRMPDVALKDSCSKEMMSPSTPVVVKLDQADRRLKEKLFKAIKDKDIELVKFYLGWSDDAEDDSPSSPDSTSSPSKEASLCHPLCQCHKCQNLQKRLLFNVTPMTVKLPGDSLHVDCQNQKGFTPLHVAVIEDNLEALALFVKKGANVNMQNALKVTPLHLACFKNHFQMVKLLVSHGANVNLVDSHGEIPLHLACAHSGPGTVIYLIQLSSTVNLANVDGNTPLHQAAAHNALESVRLLLGHGANPEVWNKKGHAPHHLTQNHDIEHLLIQRLDAMRKEKLSKYSNLIKDAGEESPESLESTENQEKKLQEELSESIKHFDKHAGLKRSQTFDHSKPSLDNIGLKLSLSIQHFDREKSLRQTQTLDRSAARLGQLKHSLSIQHFDFGTLRHVEPVDKSSPLYLVSLTEHSSNYGDYADDLTPESRFNFPSLRKDSLIEDDVGISKEAGELETNEVHCDSILQPTTNSGVICDNDNKDTDIITEDVTEDKPSSTQVCSNTDLPCQPDQVSKASSEVLEVLEEGSSSLDMEDLITTSAAINTEKSEQNSYLSEAVSTSECNKEDNLKTEVTDNVETGSGVTDESDPNKTTSMHESSRVSTVNCDNSAEDEK